jgi:hypothetical protein
MVIALVVTTGGLPLAYEVMKGNTSDRTTVKLYEHEGELYVLAKKRRPASQRDRHAAQAAGPLVGKLRAMRKSLPKRDQLLLRIGAARKEVGRAFGFVKIQMPPADQAVTRETFSFEADKAKLKAAQQRDGHYLLRSNLTGEYPAGVVDAMCSSPQSRVCSARRKAN